jgi:hypothetical protein
MLLVFQYKNIEILIKKIYKIIQTLSILILMLALGV